MRLLRCDYPINWDGGSELKFNALNTDLVVISL